MPSIKVLNMQGASVGEMQLKDEIFAVEPNVAAMHLVVRSILANKRQGTQSALTRGMVRGGGRKIAPAMRAIMATVLPSSPTAAWCSLPSPVIT